MWNDGYGVVIQVVGDNENIDAFIKQIPLQLPPLAIVSRCNHLSKNATLKTFRLWLVNIIKLKHPYNHIETSIAADAVICQDCLTDIADSQNRRYRYPFTNCTHCGPRFSII